MENMYKHFHILVFYFYSEPTMNITDHVITPFIAYKVFAKYGSRNKTFSKLADGHHTGENLCTQRRELHVIDANFPVSMSAVTAPLPLTCQHEKDTREEDNTPSLPRKGSGKPTGGELGYRNFRIANYLAYAQIIDRGSYSVHSWWINPVRLRQKKRKGDKPAWWESNPYLFAY